MIHLLIAALLVLAAQAQTECNNNGGLPECATIVSPMEFVSPSDGGLPYFWVPDDDLHPRGAEAFFNYECDADTDLTISLKITAPHKGANSVWIAMDSDTRVNFHLHLYTTPTWDSLGQHPFPVTQGVHVLHVLNREDGTKFYEARLEGDVCHFLDESSETEAPELLMQAPMETTADPTEATMEPTTADPTTPAPTAPQWCPSSDRYLNHRGTSLTTISRIDTIDACEEACDDYVGEMRCNFVWFFHPTDGRPGRCRLWGDAHKLKPRNPTDVRKMSYAGRLCGVNHVTIECRRDVQCWTTDTCNMETKTCEPGLYVPEGEDMTFLVDANQLSTADDVFGVVEILFATVGVVGVFYGLSTAVKGMLFRKSYTHLQSEIADEEL